MHSVALRYVYVAARRHETGVLACSEWAGLPVGLCLLCGWLCVLLVCVRTCVRACVRACVIASLGRNANKTVALNGTFVDYAAQWAVLVDESQTPGVGHVLTWNIGLRDCSDYDSCFGIAHATGTCVCYL